MALLNRTVKSSFIKRWHLSKEQKEVRVIEWKSPSMVDLRILPRLSSMPSDSFSTSHEGGGKLTSHRTLCCGDYVAALQPEYPGLENPNPSQPVMPGPCTQTPQPRELSSVLTGGWAVALEQTAG